MNAVVDILTTNIQAAIDKGLYSTPTSTKGSKDFLPPHITQRQKPYSQQLAVKTRFGP